MQLPLLLGATAGLLLPVIAQTSVTQIFLPFADAQPLDASLIAQGKDAATLAVQCAPGTPAEDCGLPNPVTVTAGPSTFHFSGSGSYSIFGVLDCKLTGTTEASCVATQPSLDTASIATATDSAWLTESATASFTTTGDVTGSEITFLPVTITAGLNQANSVGTSTSSGPTMATLTNGASPSGSTAMSSQMPSKTSGATSDATIQSVPLGNFGGLIAFFSLLMVVV